MKCLWLALALALAGCASVPATAPVVPAAQRLPPMPADLAACFERAGVAIPRRDLTVAEVERLWKGDRLTITAIRNCGRRAVAWYGALRTGWH